MKDFQATGEAFSPQKRTSNTSNRESSLLFPFFVRLFFLADQNRCGSMRIRIRTHNTGIVIKFKHFLYVEWESYFGSKMRTYEHGAWPLGRKTCLKIFYYSRVANCCIGTERASRGTLRLPTSPAATPAPPSTTSTQPRPGSPAKLSSTRSTLNLCFYLYSLYLLYESVKSVLGICDILVRIKKYT